MRGVERPPLRPAARRALVALACALAAALLAVATAPRRAHAQGAPASREERDREARTEFNAGREAFSRGNYEEAARRFERAYFLSQRAQLYYNIGTTYDRLHRWVEARDAFERYLQAFPEAMERDEIRARLTVIENEIRRERELRENSGRPIIVVRPGRDRVIVRPVPLEPPHPWRYVAIASGSLAVVAGAAAGIIAIVSASFYDSNLRDCGDQSMMWMQDASFAGCPAATVSDLELRATIINVLIGGAAGLAALALVGVIVDVATARPPAAAPNAAEPAPAGRQSSRRRPRGPAGFDPWRLRATFAPITSGSARGDLGPASGALTGGMFVLSGAL